MIMEKSWKCQICIFFVTAKKLSSNLEVCIFQSFPQNVANAKLGREMVMEKYFVQYVGTLTIKRAFGPIATNNYLIS